MKKIDIDIVLVLAILGTVLLILGICTNITWVFLIGFMTLCIFYFFDRIEYVSQQLKKCKSEDSDSESDSDL